MAAVSFSNVTVANLWVFGDVASGLTSMEVILPLEGNEGVSFLFVWQEDEGQGKERK